MGRARRYRSDRRRSPTAPRRHGGAGRGEERTARAPDHTAGSAQSTNANTAAGSAGFPQHLQLVGTLNDQLMCGVLCRAQLHCRIESKLDIVRSDRNPCRIGSKWSTMLFDELVRSVITFNVLPSRIACICKKPVKCIHMCASNGS